jgi:hypothetical protein
MSDNHSSVEIAPAPAKEEGAVITTAPFFISLTPTPGATPVSASAFFR